MQAEDVLRFHPEIQAQLDEIMKKGWKYLFIEIAGTALSEVAIENLPCRLRISASFGSRSLPPPPVMEMTFVRSPPDLKGVPEVQEFRINVSSKSYPRATTVDLASGRVLYMHDAFWGWNKSWAADGKKVSEAKEIYEIATWLVDVKKFKLAENLRLSRYEELAEQFRAMTP
jgi:hypothetical protein